MSLGHGASVVRDGLVLHLDAANVKSYPGSGTTWSDLSGNGNNATLVGNASTVTYSNNGYFQHTPLEYYGAVDSSSSGSTTNGAYWEVSGNSTLSPSANNGWTVIGFLNINGPQSGNGSGWFHKSGTADERGVHLEPISNTFRVNGSSGWRQMNINVSSYQNSFNSYAISYSTTGVYGTDTGTLTFYINGNQTSQITSFIPEEDNNADIWLGRRNGHLRHFLDGQVANYQYYNRELTDSEIKQNFEALRGRYGI